MSRTRWVGEFDFVESLELLPRGPTSLVLRNLTELGSGKIFYSQARRRHRVQLSRILHLKTEDTGWFQ